VPITRKVIYGLPLLERFLRHRAHGGHGDCGKKKELLTNEFCATPVSVVEPFLTTEVRREAAGKE